MHFYERTLMADSLTSDFQSITTVLNWYRLWIRPEIKHY